MFWCWFDTCHLILLCVFAVIATKFTVWLQVFLGMPGCRHCFSAMKLSRDGSQLCADTTKCRLFKHVVFLFFQSHFEKFSIIETTPQMYWPVACSGCLWTHSYLCLGYHGVLHQESGWHVHPAEWPEPGALGSECRNPLFVHVFFFGGVFLLFSSHKMIKITTVG